MDKQTGFMTHREFYRPRTPQNSVINFFERPHALAPQTRAHWKTLENILGVNRHNETRHVSRRASSFSERYQEMGHWLCYSGKRDSYVEPEPEKPGAEAKSNRHAAYRSFIFWQHGWLGQGNRRVIPSCCVTAIREKYPSPNRRYTGFIQGLPLLCSLLMKQQRAMWNNVLNLEPEPRRTRSRSKEHSPCCLSELYILAAWTTRARK